MSEKVVVIGAGIAGIQASLDLADLGYEVHLIEKTPSIGGHMAQLDKTFPTNDCSICILSPKMIMCAEHENITLHTYSEIEKVEGEFPSFKVEIREKARYIDIARCTGCGDCIEKCPIKVPSEFEEGITKRKAIYMPFPQAVPRKVTIDAEHCIKITKDKCAVCMKVCQAGAIDYEQTDNIVALDVSAIVIATGFDLMDPSELPQYGYGICRDVITSMQLERILSASGPTGGRMERPSDQEEPSNLAFIQCVGSRDARSHIYCSSVCCMYATKESILAHEHAPDIKITIFYIDMRAVGKGFQDFILRAKRSHGVRYIRSRPASVQPANGDNGVLVRYEAPGLAGESITEEYDLLVLCPALVASRDTAGLAGLLRVELDEDDFIRTPRARYPTDSTRKGVLVCGFSGAPMDIPDSVAQASGVAARVAELLAGGDS